MADIKGTRIHITGVVQGVGFRPFVYGLALRLNLTGWVRNTSAGVDIEADGPAQALIDFAQALTAEAPPLARIDHIWVFERQPDGFSHFEIIPSEPIAGAFQPISPDVSICPDCLEELFDPQNHRYRYPFINCTNCGPRFTIIEDIPYDRPLTTMAPFEMCPVCAAEYKNPLDRRFHAQPVACPVCGPHVWLELGDRWTVNSGQREVDSDQWAVDSEHWKEGRNTDRLSTPHSPISAARRLLALGYILAIKGLGGFHLACDATNAEAVTELRHRKLRVDKPFALMMADMATVEGHCQVNEIERRLLESHQRPIVILRRRSRSTIAAEAAPGQQTLGVMLPYTPLHYLLLEPEAGLPQALVMTSGNLSEEPIATGNDEARRRLASLADAFLLHNRGIRTRCDDSVVRVFPALKRESQAADRSTEQSIYPLRRSRGYAPFPVKLARNYPPLLAAGAELKNTFCLTNGEYAFLSHHIGDLENYETLLAYEDGVAHFERLFRVQPQALAYDLHPDYLSTRYALQRARSQSLLAVGVQHHHAHIAAAMAEHGLDGDRPVIGVSFDGTGYGDDGAIWGGEFLVADYHSYHRPYHLAYFPMPGGDKAIKEPWRLALALLDQANVAWEEGLPPVDHLDKNRQSLEVLRHQLRTGLNSPLTSSIGRLFDAVSALTGVRQVVNYEAQAAIELEALIDPDENGAYQMEISNGLVDYGLLVSALVADLRAGLGIPVIAARFHNSLAHMVLNVCVKMRQSFFISEVALSGGVWQNMSLLAKTIRLLEAQHFTVFIHRLVPTNDGGLALGQAVIAGNRLQNGV